MYQSLEEIVKMTKEMDLPFWKIIQKDDCEEQLISEKESFELMRKMARAMKDSCDSYDPLLRSPSGLVGTEGEKLRKRRLQGRMICSGTVAVVMEKALRISESNACMKRIVAAPTAGSCGVLPAVLFGIAEEKEIPGDEIVKALYTAAGIGGVIASRAFLAGAEGGCQAEIGSASAMASGALVSMLGGSPEEIVHASAIALKGLLGLACDPVAGLVEVPCVKRNVLGAVNALTAADMSLAGIRSRIPPDEVIDAMKSIGRGMNADIKETGDGGLASTPTGTAIKEKMAENAF